MQALSKSDLRKIYLNKRLSMPVDDKKSADLRLLQNFFANVRLEPHSVISGYWPIKGEADVLPVLQELRRKGHKCLLPHLVSTIQPLTFLEWDEDTPMRTGVFNIREPDNDKEAIPDVILVPFIAFSENRDRIGYGAGLYDRTIAAVKKHKTVFVIGIGYEMQRADNIPTENNDVSMDMVVTDGEIYI